MIPVLIVSCVLLVLLVVACSVHGATGMEVSDATVGIVLLMALLLIVLIVHASLIVGHEYTVVRSGAIATPEREPAVTVTPAIAPPASPDAR